MFSILSLISLIACYHLLVADCFRCVSSFKTTLPMCAVAVMGHGLVSHCLEKACVLQGDVQNTDVILKPQLHPFFICRRNYIFTIVTSFCVLRTVLNKSSYQVAPYKLKSTVEPSLG